MNNNYRAIDLTYAVSNEIPKWDDDARFELTINTDYSDCTPPDLFRTQTITCNVGMGTHMDAPAHVIPGGRTIDQFSLEELIAQAVMIDVSSEANESFIVMPSAVEQFEQKHGPILPGVLVFFYTGWGKYWESPLQYRNNHKFPSLHESTAKLLVQKGIVGIGIDTLSCDIGQNGFPVHRVVLGADKYLIENVANLDQLSPTGSQVFVMPMKIKEGTEASVRLIVVV